MTNLLLVAAAALIDSDGRVLAAQRPEGKNLAGLWEFPGGKLDAGETPEVALIRELKEELDIDIEETCLAPLAFYSGNSDRFHLLMLLFVCRKWRGIVMPMEDQSIKWVPPENLPSLEMPPGDKALVAQLRDYL